MIIDTSLVPSDTPLIYTAILAFLADAPDEDREVDELATELQCDAYRVHELFLQLKKRGYARRSYKEDLYGRPLITITEDGHRLLDHIEVFKSPSIAE